METLSFLIALLHTEVDTYLATELSELNVAAGPLVVCSKALPSSLK